MEFQMNTHHGAFLNRRRFLCAGGLLTAGASLGVGAEASSQNATLEWAKKHGQPVELNIP